MPVRSLPSNPNLDHLRHQAKDLLRDHADRKSAAAQRIREFNPEFSGGATDTEIFNSGLSLAAAQLTIAREYGFRSWTRLKAHVESPGLISKLTLPHHERIDDAAFRRAVELLDTGDAESLRKHLQQNPDLVYQHVVFEGGNYFRNPTLLEFVAENPVRHGSLPANIVEITRVILDAGPDQSALDQTLLLVCTGRMPRECHVQIPLIDLLCSRGADPNVALRSAVVHGESEAAGALIRHGAQINLSVAAGLGLADEFRRLFTASSEEDRHMALAFASQFGYVEIVRMLLDAGQDPSAYNPVGGHSHSTPLHQAALGGTSSWSTCSWSVVQTLIGRICSGRAHPPTGPITKVDANSNPFFAPARRGLWSRDDEARKRLPAGIRLDAVQLA